MNNDKKALEMARDAVKRMPVSSLMNDGEYSQTVSIIQVAILKGMEHAEFRDKAALAALPAILAMNGVTDTRSAAIHAYQVADALVTRR